jgi:hypothetical protein
LRDQPGRYVGRTAGRKRDDDLDRPFRIFSGKTGAPGQNDQQQSKEAEPTSQPPPANNRAKTLHSSSSRLLEVPGLNPPLAVQELQ